MQARQLAVSGESVYILGLDDQLRFIVRAEEGLWGPWQETGVSGKAIVHAGAVIGRLDPDGRVSALQRVPALPWHEWEGPADEITATNLSHGAPALFAVTAGELRYTWKPTPAGPCASARRGPRWRRRWQRSPTCSRRRRTRAPARSSRTSRASSDSRRRQLQVNAPSAYSVFQASAPSARSTRGRAASMSAGETAPTLRRNQPSSRCTPKARKGTMPISANAVCVLAV